MLTKGVDIRPSPTHNVGLFATEAIPAGTAVWLPCPKCSRWSADEVGRLPADRFAALDAYGHLLDDGSLLLPCLGAYLMNHSCRANVLDFGLDFGVTVRDVEVGEEVTCDYATFTEDKGWRMACRCDAVGCRGVVTTAEGGDPALRAGWRARVEAVLPRIAEVAQPLHDVLVDVSEPYRRARAGARALAHVSTSASVCAPTLP
ncbi:SET domain-containing protein [Streptomyces profundus]|uniref:SET domain-containing protein n=1 Tax=Streptomyces profundus TaxID=2867410 RepID=UPI001D16E56B|nr:SET domain-containing protein [Streptomyces sp. MA3_2.13]UED86558.1 SET domain-containing protein [Streptomyces sp. MA3_2.13]